ncbi:MAG TPA: hypothetical protein VJ372_01030 [Pyrinomonadaceae bacterium]|nr:hypothetical protein [Pyrinomonadaceae bacterium]
MAASVLETRPAAKAVAQELDWYNLRIPGKDGHHYPKNDNRTWAQ